MGALKGKTVMQTQTSTSDPWGPSQEGLRTGLNEGLRLYNQDVGYKPWAGDLQAGLSDPTQQAISQVQGIAGGQGGLLGQQAYDFGRETIGNQGISANMQPALGTLEATARGDNLGTVNPYLQSMLDKNAADASNRVNASMSAAGRYGSGAHTASLTRGIMDSTNPILAQNYENERSRQLSAAQGLTDIYGAGLGRSMQMAGNAAGLTDNLYDPANRMYTVGGLLDDRSQALLDAQVANYDAQQARPWDQLGRLMGIASGAGQLGGTGTQTAPTQRQSGLLTGIGAGTAVLSALSKAAGAMKGG